MVLATRLTTLLPKTSHTRLMEQSHDFVLISTYFIDNWSNFILILKLWSQLLYLKYCEHSKFMTDSHSLASRPSLVRHNTSNLLWRDVGVPKEDPPTPLIRYHSNATIQ